MRFSNFLALLTVIFSLQIISVYTDNPFVGTWVLPEIRTNNCRWCCVPITISIEKSSSDKLQATFRWDKRANYTSPCKELFQVPYNRDYINGTAELNENSAGGFYSSKIVSWDTFYFQILSDGRLNIYNADLTKPCNFAMAQNYGPPSQNLSDILLIIPAVILIALNALRIYYNHLKAAIVQKLINEAAKLQQEPEAQPEAVPPYCDAPPYMAPCMYVYMTPTTAPDSAQEELEMTNETASKESQKPDFVEFEKDIQRLDRQINLKLNESGNQNNKPGGGFLDSRFDF